MLPGRQRPRLEHRPDGVVSSALSLETVELVAEFGMVLDEWQAYDLSVSMGIRSDGMWAASEVGIDCPRQNGKGGILEARQVGGLFLLEEPLQVHTTHVFTTTQEHFLRLRNLIEGGPDEYARRAKFRVANGQMEIAVRSPRGRLSRLRFLARKGGSGRGFSGDVIYIDEAMDVRPGVMASLRYTMRARPNPQLWLTASAPLGSPTSADWRTTIRQAERGTEPRLAFCGHSIDPAEAPGKDVSEREVIRLASIANPSLGTRITHETVLSEFRKARDDTDPDTWREWMRETLGVPDPDPFEEPVELVGVEAWEELTDADSRPSGALVVSVDVAPGSESAALAVAGRSAIDREHVEVVDVAPGVAWVVARLERLLDRHEVDAVAVEAGGPVGVLLPDLRRLCEARRVELVELPGRAYAAACQGFVDGVSESRLAHLGQAWLSTAVGGARQRKFADLWVWDRWGQVDVTPLVAVTVALRVWLERKPSERRSAYEDESLMVV